MKPELKDLEDTRTADEILKENEEIKSKLETSKPRFKERLSLHHKYNDNMKKLKNQMIKK